MCHENCRATTLSSTVDDSPSMVKATPTSERGFKRRRTERGKGLFCARHPQTSNKVVPELDHIGHE